MTRLPALLSIAALVAPMSAVAGPTGDLDAFARTQLHLSSYKWGEASLNSEEVPEQFLYATAPAFCGSGGCTLFVLQKEAGKYKVVLRSTVVQLPIRLLPTKTHGWHDIAVNVSGGEIKPGAVRLRFNGERYPSNPTLAPRLPIMMAKVPPIIAQ